MNEQTETATFRHNFWSIRATLPELSTIELNLIVATFLMLVDNGVFWRKMNTIFADAPLNVLTFGGAVWVLTFFLLTLVSVRGLHRTALSLMVIIAAGASYFQDQLGAVIDREMIQNAMLTTVAESRHLMTPGFLLHLALFGVLPSLFIFLVPLRRQPLKRAIWMWPLTLVASLVMVVALLMTDYKAHASVIRQHHDLLGAQQPGSTINAVTKYARMQMRSAVQEFTPIGLDARKGPLLVAADRPVLMVVFVGETVRAANFGLDGYERDTTPGLRGKDLINFTDATACGTSTAVSLPCMFSPFAARDYSREKFVGHGNLLDVLDHAGLAVQWWDNNTGDQGIAQRLTSSRIDATLDAGACEMGECTDQAFLKVLSDTLADGIVEDTVLVLHMIGSHGPAYYLRYPEDTAVYKPDCRTSDFSKCSRDEIVNAYDNSVMFTDRILTQAIDLMAAQDKVIPAMVFLSDHGESLGEGGLYLHAAPVFMAPDTQLKVPFLMWLSEPFRTAMALDAACIDARAGEPVSQDNLFHTVLGLMDVATEVREPDMDLTDGCRKPASS